MADPSIALREFSDNEDEGWEYNVALKVLSDMKHQDRLNIEGNGEDSSSSDEENPQNEDISEQTTDGFGRSLTSPNRLQ